MKSKKEQIITAFENLDADALEKLLDDNITYQDVPKKLFVDRYREYFQNFIEDEEVICDFKAYPGKCNGCSKGIKGYSFVNSQDTCYAELLFIEGDDDFLDIYSCSDFDSTNLEISDCYGGLSFCDDEKVGYMLTFDELVEKEFCLNAIQEIENEIKKCKILPLEFIIAWQKKYHPYYGELKFFERKNFSFVSLMQNYLGSIRNALNFIELSQKSRHYLDLFEDKVFEDEEAKIMWMLACIEDIPDVKFQLLHKANEKENYITFGRINVNLALMQNYLDLQRLFLKHSYLLPHTIMCSLPYDWKIPAEMNEDDEIEDWDEDCDFPF